MVRFYSIRANKEIEDEYGQYGNKQHGNGDEQDGHKQNKKGTKCPTAVDLELIILYSAGWADHANQGAMMIRRSVGRKMDETEPRKRYFVVLIFLSM